MYVVTVRDDALGYQADKLLESLVLLLLLFKADSLDQSLGLLSQVSRDKVHSGIDQSPESRFQASYKLGMINSLRRIVMLTSTSVYGRYFWNSSEVLFDALNEIGVPTAYDPNTGLVAGASFLPMDIDPATQERCTARRAYYDPYADRPNLWVTTGQTVTQILFAGRPSNAEASAPIVDDTSVGQGYSPGVASGIFGITTTLNATAIDPNSHSSKRGLWKRALDKLKRTIRRRQTVQSQPGLVATGVEYAAHAGAPRQTVSAKREVVVAAGALHSPQLLMLSGIGPAAALEDQGITVNADIPGVGKNLQDHGQVWAWYPYYNGSYANPTELLTDHDFATHAWDQYWTNRSGPLTTSAIAGVAFPSLPYIVNGSTDIANAALILGPQQYLPGGVDQTVRDGYARQYELLTGALQDVTRAAYELINANDGVLTVATMRPFSRGTITLRSARSFDPPIIDPRYGSNPIDVQVLQAALTFNCRLLYTESMSRLQPIQLFPPAEAPDAQIAQYINAKWQTEYHPAGTCAMSPIHLGGVVDSNLLVYGTMNLRVVDASIMPMLPAAHLQAVVYAVAEKVQATHVTELKHD